MDPVPVVREGTFRVEMTGCRQVYTIAGKNSIDFFFRPGPGAAGGQQFLDKAGYMV
jgi:hypothetical protein